MTRLFHFSEDASIRTFNPRPARRPAPRPQDSQRQNGPLVWAIDERHQPMYLFPRACPRILIWRTPETTEADIDTYFGDSRATFLAYVERSWQQRIARQSIHRYELPTATFRALDDAGMWVSESTVRPTDRVRLDDLPSHLARHDVELGMLDSLLPLRRAWASSLHVSGIRLRNAIGWQP